MEHLVGYDNAILIDAFRSEEAKGSILVMRLEDMPNYSAFHTTSVHDASLQNALEFGSRLGAKCRNILWLWAFRQKNALNFVRV
jgi:Ni,Fe-hydrogenase maturation factor